MDTGPCGKGEKMLKTWYSFLLCCLSLRLEANPGLKVRITQKGLDYGSRIGMELLKQALLKETFPSWSGQESFSVVKVNYVISRLRINAVDFPETSASFIPGTGVSLSVAHASATISADWRMNTWLLKDQGGITVSISGLFIAVIFKVSRDSTGRLSILLHNCQLSINSLKVKLNGGSSWIYSFLSGYLEKPIHTKLDKNIFDMNVFMLILYALVLSQIDAFAQIDYSLVSSPAVFKSHINLDLKGDSMLYLGVSSYFIKSASLAYYRAGVFNITISKELATTFNLNTALFKDFVPEVGTFTYCSKLCNSMPSAAEADGYITTCDSQYQRQFDNNQTEVDYLITSEEVTRGNLESNINDPNIRTQQNFIVSA
ncbi:PREDICTED: BPI fold-containing family C protein-like [Haliaeetus leucocephalus]|uniref:BPI fold-containing family C protein-like n=1 Tax=Haliaeetus leucocephalus TaxID=52644 RepID=UPI000522A37B|nr:PREDICTED: BPI fold-containing family C protein-like [Haliaeetus albicilla]XP_010583758.1 PREDICTED: BPI fold-containing family C protein-like [Haliaeetus leucocephalus]